MSHTTSYTTGDGVETRFHANADGSGDVTISVHTPGRVERVEVPFEHLKAFVLSHLRDEKIRHLEAATGAELERLLID
ncbi:hypothetical protein Drose_05595 [Dactylosporangium roseum]|uniref:Uncharacterized protein n=1 Tax=Dactylosporangium roseum TaxID=47989 RepID=A0ABY5ZAM2_9ACTN|nr:hypothetical protein [Dactylosporangium roseum]UWZ37743.1 hypothetical protein Drose_05595 [Dactylosporangium roseum]